MALDFGLGCLGGFAGTLVDHPFDTVKVRLQSQDKNNIKYKGTWNCFSQIIKKESMFGLYKGMVSPLYGQIGINAIVFGIHGNVLKALGNRDIKSQFFAGAVAGGVQSVIASPMELVKIRFQMQGEGVLKNNKLTAANQKYFYDSPTDCLKKIYKHEGGAKGLFRGMSLTLVRCLNSFGIYFASYDFLCKKTDAVTEECVNVWKLLLCGGTAGSICWLIAYPTDVIKTRQQMDGMGRTKYKGVIDCTLKSIHEEGYRVLFRGLNATLLRAFPTNAATLATVTVASKMLE